MNPTRNTRKRLSGINQGDEKDGMEKLPKVEGAASTPTTELFAGIFAERAENILFSGAFSAALGGCVPLFGDAFPKGSKLFTAFVAAVATAFTAPVTGF
jgi:hypothetical protein